MGCAILYGKHEYDTCLGDAHSNVVSWLQLRLLTTPIHDHGTTRKDHPLVVVGASCKKQMSAIYRKNGVLNKGKMGRI